jgi:hypothetical protein
MRKVCLAILSISVLVGSFSAKVAAQNCGHVQATFLAHDDGKNPNATSGQGKSSVEIVPDTVTVKQGCPFFLMNPGEHSVSTRGAKEEDWLKKDESGSQITFDVPDDLIPPDEEVEWKIYKYTVEVEGIGKLDPRARVKK